MNDSQSQFEQYLSQCIEDFLAGQEPNFQAYYPSDEKQQQRLREALRHAVQLLPAEEVQAETEFQRLGSYVIDKEIGAGGMGKVFLARDRASQRQVALKVLPQPYSFLAENRERFRRESLAQAKIEHPAVVPILEVGEDGPNPFVAMEYAPEGSLEDFLQELRALDFAAARKRGLERLKNANSYEHAVAKLFLNLAEGLQAIHEAGIIHRDIKPGNILLDDKECARITDFGLALNMGMNTLTQSAAILGTRQYLAPELTYPGTDATKASDIYSLGVTLYELLTLEQPFRGVTEETLFKEIRGKVPVRPQRFNKSIPKPLEWICLKSISKNSRHRYKNASQMAEDLKRHLNGLPLRNLLASRLSRVLAQCWYRRVPLTASIIALLLVASLIVAGYLTIKEMERQKEQAFVTHYRNASAILTNDRPTIQPRFREPALAKAKQLFERCTELQPSRWEGWLSLTEVAVRSADFESAEDSLEKAIALGASGWNVEVLNSRITARNEIPTIDENWDEIDPIVFTRGWSPENKFAFGHALWSDDQFGKAYILLSDPAILRHSLLTPLPLLATCIRDDAFSITHPNQPLEIFANHEDALRYALILLDRFLEKNPGHVEVGFNRATLIRDAIARRIPLGRPVGDLLQEAESLFRDYLKNYPEPIYKIQLAKTILMQGRPLEALQEIQDIPETEYASLTAFGRENLFNIWVANRQYDLAYAWIKTRFVKDTRYTRIHGAISAIQTAHESVLQYGNIEPDRLGFYKFYLSHRKQLRKDDFNQVDYYTERRWHIPRPGDWVGWLMRKALPFSDFMPWEKQENR